MTKYMIEGKWVSAMTAYRKLRRAADTLRNSDIPVNRDVARAVDRSVSAIAARPDVADDIIRRAAVEREMLVRFPKSEEKVERENIGGGSRSPWSRS